MHTFELGTPALISNQCSLPRPDWTHSSHSIDLAPQCLIESSEAAPLVGFPAKSGKVKPQARTIVHLTTSLEKKAVFGKQL